MLGANFSLLHNMQRKVHNVLGALAKFIDMLKIGFFPRKNGYFYKTSTSAIEFVSRQPNTVDLFRSFELAYQCMEMLNSEQEVVSHPFQHCPSSLQRLCCPSIMNPCQFALHYKLYSLPRCIFLNLCFWFLNGISLSLGFELVTVVPPDRAVHVSGT